MPKTTDPIENALRAMEKHLGPRSTWPGKNESWSCGSHAEHDADLASGTGTDFAVDLSGPRQLSDALASHDNAKLCGDER